jgi:zinc D-Ala-D-Ala dipeptidase
MVHGRTVSGCRALAACGLLVSLASGCSALEPSARAEATANRAAVPASSTELERDARAAIAASCAGVDSPIDPAVTQLVVVTASGFDVWRAQLQRYARTGTGAWQAVGEPLAVVLGRAGYAWGDGVHGTGAPAGRPGPLKREGDGRSPAGVFALGVVHGYAAAAPAGMTLPYERATAAQRCVDDPRAAQYNRVVESAASGDSWRTAERMRRDDAVYELALDIEHNRSPVVPGHGSCIFAHVWVDARTPVAGCTGMALPELRELLTWLKPGAMWVALPIQEYQALRGCWKLPDSPNQG